MLCSISACEILPELELPRSGMARSGIITIIEPITISACDQPKRAMNSWLSGAKINMPAEPAAVPRPKAKERCCGVTWRAKADKMMPNPPAPMPSPINEPPRYSSKCVAAVAMRTNPAAKNTADKSRTFHDPYLSAMAPKNGCPSPQNKFCRAIANPNVWRSQLRSEIKGSWNRPSAERGPIVKIATRQPVMMMSQGNETSPLDCAAGCGMIHSFKPQT